MILYHASPTPGLTVLKPSVTEFFGKPRQVCLTSLKPMALMYGVKRFEYTYGYAKDGGLVYEEYFPGALEESYGGKSASLYVCSWREDMAAASIPNEYATPEEVPVEEEILIPDLLEALLAEERSGTLKIVRWAELPDAKREWIVKVETEEILSAGLAAEPDAPRARYMREKYPESWALALSEREERR